MADVVPLPLLVSAITTGGTPVIAIPIGPNGGVIVNPLTATDQGVSTAEVLYVCINGDADTVGNGTVFALQPGQKWDVLPGQSTYTSVNADSDGHKFSGYYY